MVAVVAVVVGWVWDGCGPGRLAVCRSAARFAAVGVAEGVFQGAGEYAGVDVAGDQVPGTGSSQTCVRCLVLFRVW